MIKKRIRPKQHKIDEEDDLIIGEYSIYINNNGYAIAYRPGGNRSFVHNIIMKPKVGFFVDHINGDRADNRRSNLRIVNKQQNSFNSIKTKNKKSSKYKGVSKQGALYRAYINASGKRTSLKYHRNERLAAIAYDQAAREMFGEYARVNFPKKGERGCLI